MGLQGQDEADETREALESCNAIGGAIEFTSVSIDAIKVLSFGPYSDTQCTALGYNFLQVQGSWLMQRWRHINVMLCQPESGNEPYAGAGGGRLHTAKSQAWHASCRKSTQALTRRQARGSQCNECLQDPADKDEQARVMSQAQALLECVADLVALEDPDWHTGIRHL